MALFLVEAQFIYGNPTGQFNLSLPEKQKRSNINHRTPVTSYRQFKKAQNAGVATEFANRDIALDDDDIDDENAEGEEDNPYEGLDVRTWGEHALVTEFYKIDIIDTKYRAQIKVEVGVEPDESDENPLNCKLPISSYMTQVYGNGISYKPMMALISKIDPSKPLGKLKLTVGSKIIKTSF